MPRYGSPTVRRRRLAAELHRLRERTGLTGDEVAERLSWSPSKISRIENARTGLSIPDARSLLDVYGVEGNHREELLTLAREASRKGWWEAHSASLSEEYAAYIAAEAEADTLWDWEPQIVPGLLQTDHYARAVTASWQSTVKVPRAVVERRVETRLQRQQVLRREPPLQLVAVVDESVLLRRFGDDAVMRTQLEHLLDVSRLPNITLRVLPLDEYHPVTTGSFVYLQFPRLHEAPLDDVVVVEQFASSYYVEEEKEVFDYRLAFECLVDASLNPERSRHLISKAMRQTWR